MTRSAEGHPPSSATTLAATFERLCRQAVDSVSVEGSPGSDGVSLLAVGIADIREALKDLSSDALETLSVRSSVTAESLVLNHDANVRLTGAGKRMTGLFDFETTTPEARRWLATVGYSNYRYCRGAAGLQFKVFDRRSLVIPGPWIDGDASLLRVTDPETVQAGVAQFRRLIRSSFPVAGAGEEEPSSAITPRQWRIAILMANDLNDEAIAQRLGVSLRTVRSDIAGLLRGLGVQSRFAAGIRVSELGMVQDPWPASDVRVSPPPS